MALLNRDDWYDIARDVDWTLSYVDEKEAFPESWSGAQAIPREAWDSWDEPYRVTYRSYVAVQRERRRARTPSGRRSSGPTSMASSTRPIRRRRSSTWA
jgi:hypothetical protein